MAAFRCASFAYGVWFSNFGKVKTCETLELIREEPKLRFGCLELYVRLTDDVEVDDQRDRFVVEEDVRQRVRVHWRSADASRDSTVRVSGVSS
ncbi:unnamed protein product [Cladocopium goreaui]|uniref:Kinesin motor domain-containing protein n=1 Tax=Cladocopium goreaui TaxID=2562237 RepID=A0A9P1DCI9_9DINO|nr:unnamed protein product [Cladocopium goreaui]